MALFNLMSIFILSIIFFFFQSSPILCQQPYGGSSSTDCSITDNSTSAFGYSCNGLNKTCQSYLIFRSRPPYTTVSTISTLFSANPSLLSSLNSVSESETFEPEKEVIVPISCSCSGVYYQYNVTYRIKQGDSVSIIANDRFQGLSTCRAMLEENRFNSTTVLFPGTKVVVPVRCACPTSQQVNEGINYLVSYTVVSGDTVFAVSNSFGADMVETLEANELSLQNAAIIPYTTLLIPLEDPPLSSDTVVPPPPPSPSPPLTPGAGGKPKKTWVYVFVGVLAGAVVLISVAVTVFCLVRGKGKKSKDSSPAFVSGVSHDFEASEKPLERRFHDQEQKPDKFSDSLSNIGQFLKAYEFQELQSATDNFSPHSLITGSAYLGRINGDYAVIKKINEDVSNEINLLSKLNHFNLIRLSGFCFHEGIWCLVYEYASNGSLSEWIYGDSGKFLSWTQRIQVALDVATGLSYLHSFSNPPYVHKDINSGNILLDTDFRAKIGNFRLVRSVEGQEGDNFALTRHIIGRKGYMAPEYLENGLITTKLDVYSFGVLMLEILTGKEAGELNESMHLLDSLMNKEDDGSERWEVLIDPSLRGKCPLELTGFVFRLIAGCLNKDHTNRPNMDELSVSLSRVWTAALTWESSNIAVSQN